MDNYEKAKEILNKHLNIHGGDSVGITDGNVYRAVIDAIDEALRIHDVSSSLPSKRNCFECNEELNKEELFCSYCRRQ